MKNKACSLKKNVTVNFQIWKNEIEHFKDALEQRKSTVLKRKAGRPLINTLENENKVRQLQSHSIKCDKDFHIICQRHLGEHIE